MGWTFLLALFWVSIVTAEKTAADYYVHSLPGQPDGPLLKMHAGYGCHYIQFAILSPQCIKKTL